jgi:AsmA family/Domain of Unknown Function (DUF748)
MLKPAALILKIIQRLIGITIVLLLAGLLIVWAASPWIVRSQAPQFLEPLNYQLSESSSVRLNPFKLSLSVNELELQAADDNTTFARIENAEVDVGLFALFEKTIRFENISLNGVWISLMRGEESISVAGFKIDLAESATPTEEEETTQTASTPSDWKVDLAEFHLENFNADIKDLDQEHLFKLEKLDLSDVNVSQTGQNGSATLEAKVNDALMAVVFSFEINGGAGNILADIDIDNFQPAKFGYLAKHYVQNVNGILSLSSKTQTTLSDSGIDVTLADTNVRAESIEATVGDISVRRGTLALATPKLKLGLPQQGDISITSELEASLEDFELGPKDSKDRFFAVDNITVPKTQLTLQGADYQALIESIDISNLIFSQPIAEENTADTNSAEALFAADNIVITQVDAKHSGLSLESITLASFKSDILITETQSIANLVSLAPKPTPSAETEEGEQAQEIEPSDTQDTQSETSEAAAPAYSVALGTFTLTNPSPINLTYNAIKPRYTEVFVLEKFNLSKVNSAKPLETSHLEMILKSRYMRSNAEADIALFSEKVNLNLNANIREVALPRISPFIRTATGFDMLSGQLDADIKTAIVNDEISGTTDLTILGLEISDTEDVSTGSISESSFIPLNLALGALTDSNGKIELEVPLRGNVRSPDFGINGFLSLVAQKAALAASQSYLINTFVPYANIVTLTTYAGSYALKARVDDLIFKQGQTELDDEQKQFLDALAALLEQKTDISAKACPLSVVADAKTEGIDLSSPEHIAELKDIAEQRGQALKDYLVDVKGLPSSRVLLCRPKIDNSKGALPRIEFEL